MACILLTQSLVATPMYRYGAFKAILSSISNIYQLGKNLKEEKYIDDLFYDLDALEINAEEFEFDGDDDEEKVPLEDGNIDKLDPVVDPFVKPVVEPIVEPDVEPVL
ncbi:unnamed protein product [Brachionus calyciflorus]|uniref:Uncharacterized protein n=1 Tax=Brachionus calyciflorus TaxID=104777 RepID=A0A813ZZE9_9BILA|nr:unnamed protein product [Brachionus calyciflorus]